MLERSPELLLRRLAGEPRRPAAAFDLGYEPPLDPSGNTAPYGERRSVSWRWLAGSVLTGLSGAILLGAAIVVSFEGDWVMAERPESVSLAPARPPGSSERAAVSTRKADRLVKAEPVVTAKQSFKSPMTLRVGEREVIKVRPFVRIATSLSLTAGQYATDIPPFNPLKLFAEGSNAAERIAEPPPDLNEADASIVKRDLALVLIEEGSPALSDEEAAAQVAEERRFMAAAGKKSIAAPAPQLVLQRTLRQPGDAPAPAQGGAAEAAFSRIEVRVVPENVTVRPKTEASSREPLFEELNLSINRGDTLEQLLRANGAAGEGQVRAIVAALKGRAKLSAAGEGQRVKLLIAPGPVGNRARQIVRVMLIGDNSVEAIAAADDRGIFVSVAPPQAEDRSVTGRPAPDDEDEEDAGTGVRLYESLYETAVKNDIPPATVEDLVRVFAYDVDFQRRVSGGDTFEIFYAEDEDSPGRMEVLYAALTVAGEARRVYRYQSSEDGGIDFFDQDGRSLKKFLLRKPIAEGEFRSGFGMRFHPILHYSKMHTGVDWANRIGTPIVASGTGTIVKAGWTSGYGRHIEIQHLNGYLTTYSHLSAFARGVGENAKVRQGQVIGYLGSSGLSTGPHLHYEVLVNGHFVNPMKIKVPRGRELDGRALVDFKRQRDQVDALLAKAAGTKLALGAGQ